jgi:hypothetical protein
MCQSAVSPSVFLSVNAKMAPPFFIASFRSASSERAEERRSKAPEEGKESVMDVSLTLDVGLTASSVHDATGLL